MIVKKDIQSCIKQLCDFRMQIPVGLSSSKVKEFWGVEYKSEHRVSSEYKRKILLAKKNLDWIVFKPLVKYVGISGSVASEFAKNEDDIDLYIVVKNDSAWIYRFILYLRNFNRKKILKNHKAKQEDMFCINYICEERALGETSNLFNLNELLHVIGIYDSSYRKIIFRENSWLKEEYCILEKHFDKSNYQTNKRNIILYVINLLFFLPQLLYMYIHSGRELVSKSINGFKEGSIRFFNHRLD